MPGIGMLMERYDTLISDYQDQTLQCSRQWMQHKLVGYCRNMLHMIWVQIIHLVASTAVQEHVKEFVAQVSPPKQFCWYAAKASKFGDLITWYDPPLEEEVPLSPDFLALTHLPMNIDNKVEAFTCLMHSIFEASYIASWVSWHTNKWIWSKWNCTRVSPTGTFPAGSWIVIDFLLSQDSVSQKQSYKKKWYIL